MQAAEIGDLEYFKELAMRLDKVGHGKKGKLINEASQFLRTSRDGVYKRLRDVGWQSGKRRRKDHGQSKLNKHVAMTVSSIMVESTRANGKRLLSFNDALEIAQANGIGADVSPATLQRVMRRHGCHPSQIASPTPHVSMRSLHPNHVWQFDVSVCVLFYLDEGGLAVMDEKRFYKNKPENVARIVKKRVLRYLVTDHYTGTFFVKYYLRGGEDQLTLFDFLMEAFAKSSHKQDPFHGVPFMLIWDAGSANQSYLIKNLLDRLQVKHKPHTPGNPRAKGQVERTHDLVERGFEGRLSLMRIRDIDHLNNRAHIWMRQYNANRSHTRHGKSRYGFWQAIREEHLRVCPDREICEYLLRTKPERRQVRGNLEVNYTVKGFGPAAYSVEHVPGVRVGEYVNVCVNPYKVPNVFIIDADSEGNEILFECEPHARDAAGFYTDAPVFGESYKTARDTDIDQNRKTMAKAAYNADTQLEVDKARKEKRPAFDGEIDPISYLEEQTVAHFMDRPGIALDVPGQVQVEIKPLSHIEACKQLRIKLGRALSQEENHQIKVWYPDGVPEEELSELLARINGSASDTNSKLFNTN